MSALVRVKLLEPATVSRAELSLWALSESWGSDFALRSFSATSQTVPREYKSCNLSSVVSDPVDKAEDPPDLPGNAPSASLSSSPSGELFKGGCEVHAQIGTDLNPLRP